MPKMRLDVLLFEKGLAQSRERARALIMSGAVFVDGQRVDKPGSQTDGLAEITLKVKDNRFVSRGGYKLEKALVHFGVSPEGKICLDCGASTGGFTDCLLQNGAEKVYAVDVGYGQLDWKIRNDPRVVVLERTNARHIGPDKIKDRVDLAVIDVSFISLRLILPAVKTVLDDRGEILCLIKPQFETSREKVGKKGVVRKRETHIEVLEQFMQNAGSEHFSVAGLTYSPITGPEGNIEYLGHLVNGAVSVPEPDIASLVDKSHMELTE